MVHFKKKSPNEDLNIEIKCTGNHITSSEFQEHLKIADEYDERNKINLHDHCMHNETFIGIQDLHSIVFGNCNLQGTKFTSCNLQGSVFKKADLRRSDLYKANLSKTNLEEANLQLANLEEANLVDANMVKARLELANLKNAKLIRTRIQKNIIGDRILQEINKEYTEASRIYLDLKENFQTIGDYSAAGESYFRERVSIRLSLAPWNARKFYGNESLLITTKELNFKFSISYFLKWISALIQEFSWGYGQKPQFVIFPCLTTIIIFTFLYKIFGGIESPDQSITNLIDFLVYSLGAFTNSSIPDLEPVSRFAQILTTIESLLGVSALALFTSALAQRMGGR